MYIREYMYMYTLQVLLTTHVYIVQSFNLIIWILQIIRSLHDSCQSAILTCVIFPSGRHPLHCSLGGWAYKCTPLDSLLGRVQTCGCRLRSRHMLWSRSMISLLSYRRVHTPSAIVPKSVNSEAPLHSYVCPGTKLCMYTADAQICRNNYIMIIIVIQI